MIHFNRDFIFNPRVMNNKPLARREPRVIDEMNVISRAQAHHRSCLSYNILLINYLLKNFLSQRNDFIFSKEDVYSNFWKYVNIFINFTHCSLKL